MATMMKLMLQTQNVVDDTYQRIHEAELMRLREYNCAVRIQSWFKAIRIRCYLKHLNRCAVSIQRRWRGFLGRRIYRERLQQALFAMKLLHFTQNATKIQKVWRGFYTRKYVANYYSRKRYLEAVQIKNEIVRLELGEYGRQLEHDAQVKCDLAEKTKLMNFTADKHYLVSTEVIPGVYNSPYSLYPMEIEAHMRKIRPDMMKKTRKKSELEVFFDPYGNRYDIPKPDVLPPLITKPQGPFREPAEVQKHRYEPLRPSLHVLTDYGCVEKARQRYRDEEWLKCRDDTLFKPFSHRPLPPYKRELFTMADYGEIPYGSKYFREEYKDKFIAEKDFKTVVPPIPVFDKLNHTYSMGEV